MRTRRHAQERKPVGWVTNSDEFLVEWPPMRRLAIKKKKKKLKRKARPRRKPEPAPAPEAPADPPMPQFDPAAAPKAVGHWTSEEDALLAKAVGTIGPRRWTQVAQLVPGRIGKQCRERWHNQLRPSIKKGTKWTRQEDLALHLGISKLGQLWSAIARSIPGRTDNQVKNRFNVLRNNARAHGVDQVATAAYPDDPELCQLAQANLAADKVHAARATRGPRNLKRTAVSVLNKLVAKRRQGGKQRGWTHDEHARLMAAVPAYSVNDAALDFAQYGRGVCAVDWRKVAAVVGTRSAAGCKEYWRARQRSPREYPAPPPTVKGPEEEEEEEEQMESLGLMDPQDLVAEFTEDPDLKLMAIETLDERPMATAPWTKSCALAIGRRGDRGLSFRFPPLGRSWPAPPPPLRATVLVPSTATGRVWQWMMEKERQEAERLGASLMLKKKKKPKKTKAGRALAPPPPAPAPAPPALALATEMTDFFQERKRRQEAEELAKSVFA
jgi:hypothetical protein